MNYRTAYTLEQNENYLWEKLDKIKRYEADLEQLKAKVDLMTPELRQKLQEIEEKLLEKKQQILAQLKRVVANRLPYQLAELEQEVETL